MNNKDQSVFVTDLEDLVGRFPEGQNELNQILDELDSFVYARQGISFTLALNNEWGAGKTTFLKNWQIKMEKKKVKVIYLDAFANDYIDDPLLVIVGEIYKLTKKEEGGKAFIKNAAKVIEKLTLVSGKVALNVVSSGSVQTIENELKRKGSLLEEESFQFIEQKIEEYSNLDETQKLLKEDLKNLSAQVRKETGYPLIFIIDELDRAKPTFSLKLIERIKHFCEVDNLFFIFSVNKKVLAKNIEHSYGDINGVKYLEKFFDDEISLPPIESSIVTFVTRKFGYTYFPKVDIEEEDSNLAIDFLHYYLFQKGLEENDSNIREIKKILLLYRKHKQYYRTKFNLLCFMFLCIMKIKEERIFVDLKEGKQLIFNDLPEEKYEKMFLLLSDYGTLAKKEVSSVYGELILERFIHVIGRGIRYYSNIRVEDSISVQKSEAFYSRKLALDLFGMIDIIERFPSTLTL